MSARARTGLWLATPAWGRYELSSLCFEQQARAMRELRAQGVEVHHVVAADDGNVELAERHGWDVARVPNDYLGRKFNDAIAYAYEHGAEWVAPIGSDSWIDPAYFLDLPNDGTVRTSRTYSVLTHRRLGECVVGALSPAGPHVIPRELLDDVGARPVDEEIRRGCDSSTVRNIEAALGWPMPWARRELHPHQYVGLRGRPTITSYDRIVRQWGVAEHLDPWPILERLFDGDLVERARTLLTQIHKPRRRARGTIGAR